LVRDTRPSQAFAVQEEGRRAEFYKYQKTLGKDRFANASLTLADVDRYTAFVNSGGTGWFEHVAGVSSTWVRDFGYWVQNNRAISSSHLDVQAGLAIGFKDGATCWYPSLSNISWFVAMRAAGSAGRFIHEFIYKKVGYQLIKG
jgi:hypothetical protein